MVNYVRSLHALLLSVAVLALPTAASFVVSYALDSFINFRQAKVGDGKYALKDDIVFALTDFNVFL